METTIIAFLHIWHSKMPVWSIKLCQTDMCLTYASIKRVQIRWMCVPKTKYIQESISNCLNLTFLWPFSKFFTIKFENRKIRTYFVVENINRSYTFLKLFLSNHDFWLVNLLRLCRLATEYYGFCSSENVEQTMESRNMKYIWG